MSFSVVHVVIAADVADGGTFTVPYPSGANRGDFASGVDHRMVAGQTEYRAPRDFTVSFGSSNATVTNHTGTTLLAGATVLVQLDQPGEAAALRGASGNIKNTVPIALVYVDLGAPITADADGVCASQAITAAAGGTIAGALAAGGKAEFDVPRNVVAAWTGAAVMTVTGEDAYGNVMVEKSASGTSLTGKKAFKKVTSIAVSADVTGATVGTGDVLGLPVHLPNSALVVKELQDGAAAAAGTFAAGLGAGTVSAATTGDVRGTYDPNAACDGSKAFTLLLALPDPTFLGNPQYAG